MNGPQQLCTGTILSDSLVLTEGCCLQYFFDFKEYGNVTKGFVYLNVQNASSILKATRLNIIGYRVPEAIANFYIRQNGYYFKPHENIAVVRVSPPINLTEMKIAPSDLTTSSETPDTMIIVGYDYNKTNKTIKNLDWANVTKTNCPINKIDSRGFHLNTFCWLQTETSTIKIDIFDNGGPAFDRNYNIVGVYCHKSNFGIKKGEKCFEYYVKISEKMDFLNQSMTDLMSSTNSEYLFQHFRYASIMKVPEVIHVK